MFVGQTVYRSDRLTATLKRKNILKSAYNRNNSLQIRTLQIFNTIQ